MDELRRRPGEIRDAIYSVLDETASPMSLRDIEASVQQRLPASPPSSIRSYLSLNTPELFQRTSRGTYMLREQASFKYGSGADGRYTPTETSHFGKAMLVLDDCFEWLRACERQSIHAVVTDPPYGLVEYSYREQQKLRTGRGGVWRIPPSFDGSKRSPVPRFTVLKQRDLEALRIFFLSWGRLLVPALVPGAAVIVASNPLLSYVVSGALVQAGLERRGELVRLTMTMRGGDRPKAAHEEFDDITVMPRSMWEPWLVFRKPLDGRVQDNLRNWRVGGFRRPSKERPFGDVIDSSPTRKREREIAPHPSLKPQAFLRQLVRAVLPFGEGVILDCFAGAGSTLAAAEFLGYDSIGIEKDRSYYEMAKLALPRLAALELRDSHS